MTSPIEAQFLRLKKEAEERGVMRLEDIYKKITTLKDVQREIENFDFKNLPTAYLLEVILGGALANRVSDVHIEPSLSDVKIRYRIDGLLYDAANFSLDFIKK